MGPNDYKFFIQKNGNGGKIAAAEVNHEIFIRISDNRSVPIETEKLEALVWELISKMTECETVTNGDKIRAMTDEELAAVIMCPYDTAGDPIDIMPCVLEDGTQEFVPTNKCMACSVAWLQRESKE